MKNKHLFRPDIQNEPLIFLAKTVLFLFLFSFSACGDKEPIKTTFTVEKIEEHNRTEYPDDPDLTPGFSDSLYSRNFFSHSHIDFVAKDKTLGNFDVIIYPKNGNSDTLLIPNVCLDEWIPTVPKYLRGDNILADIAIFNQQFNRVQVRFVKDKGEIIIKGNNLEGQKITRVDLAKNCLKMPLWELLAYSKNQQGKDIVLYHGWFNFPGDLHTELLIRKGWTPEQTPEITAKLISWMQPAKEVLNLDNLRKLEKGSDISVLVENYNRDTFPMPEFSERKKKFKNILYPKSVRMSDYLSDSTKFASFVPAGIYSTVQPMSTQLGRFANIISQARVSVIESKNPKKSVRPEIELTFWDKSNRKTRLIVGGFDVNKIKKLSVANANDGMQMPMGIANHTFNQSYKDLVNPENSADSNPCFAMLLDDQGHWLNSHEIGVDGVLFHFDETNERKLHIWLLSFERHAFVGHYAFSYDWNKRFLKKNE